MKRALGLAIVVSLCAAPHVVAQIGTGNIYGTVLDASGGVLPGAAVSLSGELGGRTTSTDNVGRFRFLGVDHGRHTLSVSLSGFTTLARELVVVTGTNLDLEFTLSLATVEETITVEAETPVVDRKRLGTAETIVKDELARLPSSRDVWELMRAVPGILLSRVNVAGADSDMQSSFWAKGADGKDQTWTLDGLEVTDEYGSSSPGYWNYDTFDEVRFSTGGADITVPTGGVGVHIATKRGTNTLHGSAGGYFTHDDLQWSNLEGTGLENDERLELPDGSLSDKADHIQQIADLSLDLGGPIVEDELWFYVGYGRNDIRKLSLTQQADRTVLENWTAKLNWQAGPRDMLSAFWFSPSKTKWGRKATWLEEADEHLYDQGPRYKAGWPRGLWKLEWSHVFSPSLVLTAKGAYFNNGFAVTPSGGLGSREYLDYVNGQAWGSSREHTYLRSQHTANVDGRYFAGHHELKLGLGFRRAGAEQILTSGGDRVLVLFNSTGSDAARFIRDAVTSGRTDHWSAYVGDTFTRDRLTLSAGLRFDRRTAEALPTTSVANPAIPEIMPALEYAGSGGHVAVWNDLSPRVGLTYALGEEHKTVLRASYARYSGMLPGWTGEWGNPVYTSYLQYAWLDANGDRDVQLDEVDFGNLQVAANIDPNDPTAASSPDRIDPDLGANIDHEIVLGIERELMPDLGLSLAYTWRKARNLTAHQAMNAGWSWYNWLGTDGPYSSADFEPVAPVTANGYTATSYRPTAAASADFTGGLLLSNRDDMSRTFNGLELSLVKRMSRGWMGRLAFSLNDWREQVGPGAIQNPTRTVWDPLDDGGPVAGGTRVNARWQLNVNGLYRLPHGFDIAANLFARQGYFNPAYLQLLSGFDGWVWVLPDGYGIDQDRFGDLWNLDLRLARDVRFGERVRLGLSAEMFNVLNSSLTLRQNRNATSAVFDRIDKIMPPRVVRFGARLSF